MYTRTTGVQKIQKARAVSTLYPRARARAHVQWEVKSAVLHHARWPVCSLERYRSSVNVAYHVYEPSLLLTSASTLNRTPSQISFKFHTARGLRMRIDDTRL